MSSDFLNTLASTEVNTQERNFAMARKCAMKWKKYVKPTVKWWK